MLVNFYSKEEKNEKVFVLVFGCGFGGGSHFGLGAGADVVSGEPGDGGLGSGYFDG